MNTDVALDLIGRSVPGGLSTIQDLVARHTLEGKTYNQTAEVCGYDASYIRDVGYKLWRSLSENVGEKVKKGNLQVILRKLAQKSPQSQILGSDSIQELFIQAQGAEPNLNGSNVIDFQKAIASKHRDLGAVINSSILLVDFGTEENLINYLTHRLDEVNHGEAGSGVKVYNRSHLIGFLRELPVVPSSLILETQIRPDESREVN
jgi:hypothetical protein